MGKPTTKTKPLGEFIAKFIDLLREYNVELALKFEARKPLGSPPVIIARQEVTDGYITVRSEQELGTVCSAESLDASLCFKEMRN